VLRDRTERLKHAARTAAVERPIARRAAADMDAIKAKPGGGFIHDCVGFRLMAQIILDQAARSDLIEIWQYIARDNERAADAMLDRIQRGFEVIAQFPHGGTARPELIKGLRCFSVGNYVIYFRAIANGVEIVRVLHGARDVGTIFRGSI
jgi:toxin ParE1/3/4